MCSRAFAGLLRTQVAVRSWTSARALYAGFIGSRQRLGSLWWQWIACYATALHRLDSDHSLAPWRELVATSLTAGPALAPGY